MKKTIFSFVALATGFCASAQVGINTTTPDPSAALDIASTTRGLLPPRMDNTQMNTITAPAEGLVVYCNNCMPAGLYVYSGVSWLSLQATPDANGSTKGKIQLAGDLGGTAAAPTVPGLANKENTIATGTTAQYYRGDKSWQTLDKTAVGLANVDNTTDLNKPISTATQTALDTKEATANKSLNVVTDATSDVKFPSVKAVKSYVDTQVTAATVVDADASTKGKIQLAGDLGGTAAAPTVPGLANKENTIATGTTAQYYRGDKSWQTLDKTAIGLANVDNTTDANKPISTATQTALDTKEATANKSLNVVTDATSDVKFPSVKAVKSYVDTQVTAATVVDADASTKGKIQLAGDLGGTAAAPTVPGLANKENTIAAGTTAQYYRGDKSWQTLDKTAVGLANVDNTTDANKPISTATQTALDTKEATANKSLNVVTDAASDVKFPSVKAVKSYVDTQVTAATVVDADGSTKGKIQLAGDLGGTAAAPTVPGLANKENTIAAGTTAQYYRGDKTWQTLDKTAVGLANVDNTTDTDKPISTATQTALDTKEATANKSTDVTTDATSDEKFPSVKAVKSYVDTQVTAATVVDADASTKGKIQLAGDLGGTAAAPTVPGLANKENTIAAGTTTQYYRGDKSWQNLDKTAVGLANVDNTTDANKPISTATQTALDTKEATANKSTDVTTDATSDEKFPSVKAVKTYVDTQVTAAILDADASTKGRIQLAGDLGGDASAPTIKNNAVTTTKIADANVTESKIASDAVTSAKILDGTISNSDYSNGSITNDKLTAGPGTININRIPIANHLGNITFQAEPFTSSWDLNTGTGAYSVGSTLKTATISLNPGTYLFVNTSAGYNYGGGSPVTTRMKISVFDDTNSEISKSITYPMPVSQYTDAGHTLFFRLTSTKNVYVKYYPFTYGDSGQAYLNLGATNLGGTIYKLF